MKNEIKTNQLALLLILILPGGKYLTLPAVMTASAGHDAWISMLILFAVDMVCMSGILWAIKLNKDGKSINEIISLTLGKVASKILFVIFGAFFLLRLTNLMVSSIELFASTFTIKTNWLAYSIPVCVVGVFVVSKGLTNMGRIAELLFIFIVLALLSILVFSLNRAEISNLLPVLYDGVQPVIKTALNSSFWFSDGLFILFCMDSFRPNKKFRATISLSYLFGIFLTVAMEVLFIALFDQLSRLNNIAMSKVSQFSIYLTTNGRLDWLAMSIWLMSIFLKMFLLMWCCYKCLTYVFGGGKVKFSYVTAIGLCLPVIIVPTVVSISNLVQDNFSQGWGKYVFFVVQYGVPLIVPLLSALANKHSQKRAEDAVEKGNIKGREVQT